MNKNQNRVSFACLGVLFGFLIAALMAGCTDNQRAKAWGGTSTINLPAGEKLITVTWKETQIWYLTRPMKEDETPETYTFQEKSSYGLVEGTVILKESK